MAVAFDAVGPSSAGAASTASTTLSWTHTNVGSSCALFVAVAVGVLPDAGFAVTVALDPAGPNTPFVALGAIVHSNASNGGFVALFGLPNSSAGAHTITATVTGGTPGTMEGGSVSYTGAHTVTAFSAQQSATGSSAAPSITFTGSTAENMVAGSVAVGGAVSSMSAGTSRWIRNVNSNSGAGNQGGGDIAAGGSVVLTWSTAADWWAVAAVEILAAPAGPPPEGPHNSDGMHLMGKSYY